MVARIGSATPLADLTEKAWDAQLFNSQKGLATTLGWRLVYHVLRSKGSRSGFPDRVLVRERVIYAELKREGGKPTDAQVEWLTGLAKAGAEAYLWRPSDLDEIAKILGTRWWEFRGYREYSETTIQHGCLMLPDGPFWQPASLWLPSGHRNDEHVQEALIA